MHLMQLGEFRRTAGELQRVRGWSWAVVEEPGLGCEAGRHHPTPWQPSGQRSRALPSFFQLIVSPTSQLRLEHSERHLRLAVRATPFRPTAAGAVPIAEGHPPLTSPTHPNHSSSPTSTVDAHMQFKLQFVHMVGYILSIHNNNNNNSYPPCHTSVLASGAVPYDACLARSHSGPWSAPLPRDQGLPHQITRSNCE